MALTQGFMYSCIVDRKTDIGYAIICDEEEVFLHAKEAVSLEIGQSIDVFLYMDAYKRIAATMDTPILTVGEKGLLKVMSVEENLGVFLDNGINKHILLSKDHLPLDKAFWPKKDDTLFVELKVKNRLYLELAIPSPPYQSLELLSYYGGFVNGFHKEGIRFITDQLTPVFIHESQYDKRLPIGTKRSLKVIHESSKGYTGTLLQSKETKRLSDADVILSYLELHKKMPLDASSASESIEKTFQMSRKAFKRALGYLYKTRKITFVDGQTVLIKE
ncbi:MAG: S1-like domain-containing RNA-binding protein [Acholeplasmataceae bacterium]